MEKKRKKKSDETHISFVFIKMEILRKNKKNTSKNKSGKK